MSLFGIKKFAVMFAFAFTVFVAGSTEADGQTRRQIERERQRIEREQRLAQERQSQRGGSYNRMMERAHSAHFEQGYQYGLMAGQFDRRKGKYNRSNVYRDTPSGPYGGDPTSTDYVYRQGYLQGYNDGYNGRRPY